MRTVLITGAGGNLGRAAVSCFVSSGYRVIATVSPGKSLPYPIEENVHVCQVDLSNEGMVESLIQDIAATHGHLNAALLLTGTFTPGALATAGGSTLRKMFSINFETVYFTIRPLVNYMMGQSTGGKIVLIGAEAGLAGKGGVEEVAYALSKSLIFKLSDLVNAIGQPSNVSATVIVPGTLDTEANRKALANDVGRLVKPEHVAEKMMEICSQTDAFANVPVVAISGAHR